VSTHLQIGGTELGKFFHFIPFQTALVPLRFV
jgi:hypothetical protein